MNYKLYSEAGTVEAVIDDNCGMKKFHSIANTLSRDLQISFLEKHEKFDALLWSFKYNGHLLKLHFSIYHGVSISNTNSKGNKVVTELAELLKKKLF